MNTIVNMENLKELLNRNIVTFSFLKKDGTTRQVRATRWLHKDIVGEDFPIPTNKIEDDMSIRFVDLDIMQWRACRKYSVISIDHIISEEELMGKFIDFN